MSILQFNIRPWAVFDADNKLHRKWYGEFVKHNTWGKCPYRFIITDLQGDLITMIQKKLVEYYVKKEFKNTLKS